MKIKLMEGPNATGDCYEANGRYILDHPNDGLILVHGEVEGQGQASGIRFGHCWLEDGDTVIDNSNGRSISMPKFVYYQLGNIDKINNIKKYTGEQAIKNMLKYKHWGPWNLKTSTGL